MSVSRGDIDAAKAAGGANNNWDLTQRLMAWGLSAPGAGSADAAAAATPIPTLAVGSAATASPFHFLILGDTVDEIRV